MHKSVQVLREKRRSELYARAAKALKDTEDKMINLSNDFLLNKIDEEFMRRTLNELCELKTLLEDIKEFLS